MKRFILILLTTITFSLFSQDDAFFFEEDVTSSIMDISFGGSNSVDVKYAEDRWSTNIELDVDIIAESSNLDLISNFNMSLEDLDDLADFPLQNSSYETSSYIDTLYLRYYHNYFDLEVGYLKPIWGNADGVHVVDVLNPIDYSNPFGGSYLDSKKSQQMLKINIPLGEDNLLEVTYLPTFKGDYIPLDGMWAPVYLSNMEETVKEMAYAVAISSAAELYPDLSYEQLYSTVSPSVEVQLTTFDYNLYFEEFEYFTDSQAALRYTTTINSMDLGFTYYYGYLKQPTIDVDDVLENQKINLLYNRVQLIGFDIAAQLGGFNLKGEVGYNLTDDIDGDDNSINNNSLRYILGFDVNLPINSMNLLLQIDGNTIMSSENIGELDQEYDSDGNYTSLSLMARISDSYLNETLNAEVTGVYNIMDSDFFIKPKLSYSITDNSTCYVEYLLIEGDEDTNIGQYSSNDLLTVGLNINF